MSRCAEYELRVRPFRMRSEKEAALKPLEEAAEAFGAWQDEGADGVDVFSIWYECCDVIQAACNLMWQTGASRENVAGAMHAVTVQNERRGRYGQDW